MPRPSGPVMPSPSDDQSGSSTLFGDAVRYSPGVPAGGVGGGTWSNQPPFSSYITTNMVLAQTSGLETNVSSICWTRNSPNSGGAAGCSHSARGGRIHDTEGSVPVATSAAKSAG